MPRYRIGWALVANDPEGTLISASDILLEDTGPNLDFNLSLKENRFYNKVEALALCSYANHYYQNVLHVVIEE